MSAIVGYGQNALAAYGTYSKVDDVQQSLSDIKKTYDNPNLNRTQKVAHCTAEVTFISARCGELCSKDPLTMPIINSVATVSDVGRNVIKGYNEKQTRGQILLKAGTSALSGIGETLISISKITQSIPMTVLGFAFSLSGLGLLSYQYSQRSQLTPPN